MDFPRLRPRLNLEATACSRRGGLLSINQLADGEGITLPRETWIVFDQPPVFDLLIVNLCARRLCFFLASRASANLSTICGAAALLTVLVWVSGMAFGSEW